MNTINVRVEYDATPIRHIAVQCPDCESWYNGQDIGDRKLRYEFDIFHTQFCCPICGKIFGAGAGMANANVKITECAEGEVYKGCLRKREVWE